VPVNPSAPLSRRRVGAALIAIAGLALSFLAAPTATARPIGDDGYDPSIIGGTNAVIGDAPWQVGLVFNGAPSDYQGQFCGGSILSSWEILTAAHCVDYDGDVLTASDVKVLVGTATLSTTRATAVAVASITVHPDWDWPTYANDVAVLRLAAPIALTPGVQEAIPLASATVANGTSALITGWGNTSTTGTSYPTQLKKATVSTVSDASCNSAYSGDGGIDADIMLCATGGGFTIDACQGDSGGPLVVSVGGVPTLAGITSFGIGCAEAPYPGVYTEVSAFRTWILAQQTGGPQV
jgi:secreted trypsin-like serine protease